MWLCVPQHPLQYIPLDSGLPHLWQIGGSKRESFLEHLKQMKSPTLPQPTQERGKNKSMTSRWSCFNRMVKTTCPYLLIGTKAYYFCLVLAQCMAGAAEDRFIQVDVSIPDFQVEPAFRICANPGFIMYRRPLAAEIGQRN
jgi:hypothetical protein